MNIDEQAELARLWALKEGVEALDKLAKEVYETQKEIEKANSISLKSWHKPMTI